MCCTVVQNVLWFTQEALRDRKEPGDVLMTSIWRTAGLYLLDVPECPIEIAKTVHILMGREPNPALLSSPVSQINQREAVVTDALQAISDTAQAVHQQGSQHAQQPQQQQPTQGSSVAVMQHCSVSASIAQQVQSAQQESADLLVTVLQRVGQSGLLQQHQHLQPEFLCTLGAVMTPVVTQLVQQKHALMQSGDALMQRIKAIESRVVDVHKRQLSDAAFAPLMAVAMAQLSQQVYGLGKYLAASYKYAKPLAGAGPLSPLSKPKMPENSPQRRQQQRHVTADRAAKRQLMDAGERLGNQQGSASASGQPAHPALVGAQATMSMNMGRQVVQPGKDGEVQWVSWKGRCVASA